MHSVALTDNHTPRTAIFLQDACYHHRYIRSNDISAIVERPERLRAVKIGLAAAIARLEEAATYTTASTDTEDVDADSLASALQSMNLATDEKVQVVDIVKSTASTNILDNLSVKFVHGDVDGDVYLEKLVALAKESEAKIARAESEIPQELSQGDLYLCPGSLEAIQGALGTVCEAVDTVIRASRSASRPSGIASTSSTKSSHATRAFVAIRPPGHHCGEDTPSGFCFVNNVAVAAAHAHLTHGVTKVVILDIDLHHGNGTQSIAWQINEEAYRLELEAQEAQSSGLPTSPKSRLHIFYGSLHDILSFPCEDGNTALIQAASVSIHGPHGQHIENIHLQTYTSEEDFWGNLYPTLYSKLLRKAETFVDGSDGDNVLVLISCGFDACEHEYPTMSRHNRKVPVSFYHRFTKDACSFAEKYAGGKLVSVLEGGYSDRALTSGVLSHVLGLVNVGQATGTIDESWWSVENLEKLEKGTKKRSGGRISAPPAGLVDKWLHRTLTVFSSIDTAIKPSPSRVVPPSSMTLRERKTQESDSASRKSSSNPRRTKGKVTEQSNTMVPVIVGSSSDHGHANVNAPELVKAELGEVDTVLPKKLPRVLLRVKDPDAPS